jgi:antitoxin (DNA-binding transcriptional repressor) of toxin-antitoxin stability system
VKNVSLKDLKEDLSNWTEVAAKGETVQVTRYNKPYVLLGPAAMPGVRMGSRVGESLKPCFDKDPTSGRWLTVLQEDRDDR